LSFVPRSESELNALSDGGLIDYLREAHAKGDHAAARLALQILVFGYWSHVAGRLDRKLPRHAVEDVTSDVIVRAIQSAFAGASVGEFRSWLNTITDRTIADFYRARARRPPEQPLESDDEEMHRKELGVPDGAGYAEVQLVLEAVLAELRDDHRRVVEILVFEDGSAADAAAQVEDMTADNAYQIVRRFRQRLREALEGDTG
jgi:RNA polymerase sigma factor (sigma-70 family)